MKTQIKLLSNGDVRIRYEDRFGGMQLVTYSVSWPAGGYVRDSYGRQVCDRLSHRGSTLRSSYDGLIDVIRREYRAMRRRESREKRRHGW